jgi:DNA-binding protein H-NS
MSAMLTVWPLTIRISLGLKKFNLGRETVKVITFAVCLSSTATCGRPMQPKKSSLTTLSNEALCKLRDEIVVILNSRAEDLRREIDRLTGGTVAHVAGADSGADGPNTRGKKAAPKYRGPDGVTWAGRGHKPRWLTAEMNKGKKIEEFRIAEGNRTSM